MLLSCQPALANTGNCWEASAAKYGVDPFLLAAIGRVESSFNPNAHNRNKNGTEDIGIMQINTVVLREVERFGITRDQLFEPCINIDVAAWKLATHFRDHGVTWFAVGAYHSKTPALNRIYQLKVYLAYLKLTGSTQIGAR
jgi:soluble lytic murein transglycosylase-like protein